MPRCWPRPNQNSLASSGAIARSTIDCQRRAASPPSTRQGIPMNPNTQNDLGRLLLRVTLGVLVLLHGIAKLNGGLSGIVGMVDAQGLPGVLGYAVIIGEVVAPLML